MFRVLGQKAAACPLNGTRCMQLVAFLTGLMCLRLYAVRLLARETDVTTSVTYALEQEGVTQSTDYPHFCALSALATLRDFSKPLDGRQPSRSLSEHRRLYVLTSKVFRAISLEADRTRHAGLTIKPPSAKLDAALIAASAGDYPQTAYSGRGIVMVAGGPYYSPPAYACVVFIRRSGCTLPVEVWLPPHEGMPSAVIGQFQQLGAVVKHLADMFPSYMHHLLHGYITKPAAILASSFEEVLFLDADNVPLTNPTRLFDHPLYAQHGLLMWPDFWPVEVQPGTWEVLHVLPSLQPRSSHESGQMVINKRLGWHPLALALYLNVLGDVFYPMFSVAGQGDKETYPIAWLALNRTYGLVKHPVVAVGYHAPRAVRGSSNMTESRGVNSSFNLVQTRAVGRSFILTESRAVNSSSNLTETKAVNSSSNLPDTRAVNSSSNLPETRAVNSSSNLRETNAVNSSFNLTETRYRGTAMLQRDPEGLPLFLHVHLPKVDLNVTGPLQKRKWQFFADKHGRIVTVFHPVLGMNTTDSVKLLNAVVGGDLEADVHLLRQQLRCNPAWAQWVLHPPMLLPELLHSK